MGRTAQGSGRDGDVPGGGARLGWTPSCRRCSRRKWAPTRATGSRTIAATAASGLPATEYTAARFLAYRVSQRLRNALSDDAYASFFDKGEIGPALAGELVRRYQQKRVAGHDVPDVGEVGVSP